MSNEQERIYGVWAGNEKGVKEDKTKCIEKVYGDSMISHQCRRSRGHGKYGLHCKTHDPKRIAKKQAEDKKEYDEKIKTSAEKEERVGILLELAEGIPTELLLQYVLIKELPN